MQYYTQTQIKVKEDLVVRKNIDVNEHERLSNIQTQIQEQRFIAINFPPLMSIVKVCRKHTLRQIKEV